MKVLWFSNYRFSDEPVKGTCSWIKPMGIAVSKFKEIEIYNIVHTSLPSLTQETYQGIKQYCLPVMTREERRFSHSESHRFEEMISKLISEIKPDIIHFWGTESNFLSIWEKGLITCPAFVDIQGVMSTIAPNMTKCLSLLEYIRVNLGLFELRHLPDMMYLKERYYKNKGVQEIKRLSTFKFISVQSEWTEAQLKGRLPNAQFLHTGIILRDEFYSAKPWQWHDHKEPVLFSCASSMTIPYKGLYTLLKALVIIKKSYPNVQLRLAGSKPKSNSLKPGFERLLNRFVNSNDLKDNIVFLGPLDASQLCYELSQSDICIVPSYVETYCLSLAEAQMIGTPCVVSHAGAMPEIAQPNVEAYFYDPLDEYMLAYKTMSLFCDKDRCLHFSEKSRQRRMRENDLSTLAENQVEIYKHIIKES